MFHAGADITETYLLAVTERAIDEMNYVAVRL